MRVPVRSPAATPAAGEPVSRVTMAKTKPDIAMFEAKDRSISPATTTKVIPMATMATKGMEVMKET